MIFSFTEKRDKSSSSQITLAFSLAALILYIPAMFFPFMTMELYGNKNSSTILEGVIDLAGRGSWFIAILVFLASVVIPVIKLLILFYINLVPPTPSNHEIQKRLHDFVEIIGRWSMLDIFLLAVLIAMLKFRPWAHVEAEPGSLMFALVVVFTMIASATYDTSQLRKARNEKR